MTRQEKVEMAGELFKKSVPMTKIAEKIGRSRMAVYHKVRMFEDEVTNG